MSPRNWQDRLQDIVDAIEEVNGFVRHMNLDAFQDDLRTIRAVELNFIIMGKRQMQFLSIFRKNILMFPGT